MGMGTRIGTTTGMGPPRRGGGSPSPSNPPPPEVRGGLPQSPPPPKGDKGGKLGPLSNQDVNPLVQ